MNKEKKINWWFVPMGLILIFASITILLFFLLNGKTVIINEPSEEKNSVSIVCKSDNIAYSGFAFDDSDSKFLKINATFSDDKLNSISLIYRLNYHDADALYFSEARNHSEMNQNFSKDGMKPDSLTAKYGVTNDSLQLSIFADEKDISEKILKYFMLSDLNDIENLMIDKVTEHYDKIGLECKTKYNKIKEEVNE